MVDIVVSLGSQRCQHYFFPRQHHLRKIAHGTSEPNTSKVRRSACRLRVALIPPCPGGGLWLRRLSPAALCFGGRRGHDRDNKHHRKSSNRNHETLVHSVSDYCPDASCTQIF